MGKPFGDELKKIPSTVKWAEKQDVNSLSHFMFEEGNRTPLICIGSGGSFSACHFAAQLFQKRNGVIGVAMTPLQLMYSGAEIIRSNKLLFISASGKNKDILNAIKYGLKFNEAGMFSLTLHDKNPILELLKNRQNVQNWCKEIPTGKDGFLATNSLVATFVLLNKSYNLARNGDIPNLLNNYKVSDESPAKDKSLIFSKKSIDELATMDNFFILYGGFGESVAWDIESKLTEAALGSVLISDYRNFGHGRHHWFAKHKVDSCIIALVTPIERDLAYKTIDSMPKDIPVYYIESEMESSQASIDLLIKSFFFVENLGIARSIDPGRPGVPSFGRKLYNLNYFKLTNKILPNQCTCELAVKRKIGFLEEESDDLFELYSNAYHKFIHRLNKIKFTTIAFDYDGTLSAKDLASRYTKILREDIKEELLKLLRKGVKIAIATGRGKSVGEIFKNSIDKCFWSQIKIGYYNGACILPLGEEEQIDNWKCQTFDEELKVMENELKKRLSDYCINLKLEERCLQLSIEGNMSRGLSNIVYESCCEIIWDKQLDNIRVWRSSHSMDVVVYNKASKLFVVEDPKKTLCIGDYGSIEGNDYELLSNHNSLSVDKVSKKIDSCWNIAPSGISGLDATLFYLNHLIVDEGTFKCKFKI